MSEAPSDPFTKLTEAAAQLHEMMQTLVERGFTRREALYLVACALTKNPGTPPEPGKDG